MTPEDTRCYFCEKPQDADAFCHGCQRYVCEPCSTRDIPFGAHHVDEHQDGESALDERDRQLAEMVQFQEVRAATIRKLRAALAWALELVPDPHPDDGDYACQCPFHTKRALAKAALASIGQQEGKG